MEQRKIAVLDGLSAPYNTLADSATANYDLAFDLGYNSCMAFWNDADTSQYLDIKFKEPIDISQIDICWQQGADAYSMGGVQNMVSYQPDALTSAGADNTVFNGTEFLAGYTDYNDRPYYKMVDVEAYVFVDSAKTKWCMATSLGGEIVYYTNNTSLPVYPWSGTWVAVSGTAPTVTERCANYYIPYIKYEGRRPDSGDRRFNFCHNDQWRKSGTPADANYVGKTQLKTLRFESPKNIFNTKNGVYGYLPRVKVLRFQMYSNTNSDSNHYIYSMDIWEPVLHPHNPFVLKLGSDDGTILPLANSNTGLGAAVSEMAWRCDSVVQPSGTYTVRFNKNLGVSEANGITFKEIGLFMDSDAHEPTQFIEPALSYANDMFARSIFSSAWTKPEGSAVNIFYEITVE
jgi:hypothetical protein